MCKSNNSGKLPLEESLSISKNVVCYAITRWLTTDCDDEAYIVDSNLIWIFKQKINYNKALMATSDMAGIKIQILYPPSVINVSEASSSSLSIHPLAMV
jgi:hypothetical protein